MKLLLKLQVYNMNTDITIILQIYIKSRVVPPCMEKMGRITPHINVRNMRFTPHNVASTDLDLNKRSGKKRSNVLNNYNLSPLDSMISSILSLNDDVDQVRITKEFSQCRLVLKCM